MEVTTLDIEPAFEPTIVADIREWNPFPHFKPGEFHFVWASVPCPDYSRAKTTAKRNFEESDVRTKATIQAILDLRPAAWAIENPTVLLRSRDFMRPLRKYLKPTSCCKFGFPYRKETDIWTNIPCPLPHCRLDP